MTIVLRTAVLSDPGRLRPGNEDAAVAGPRLAAVADGMGGHADGEVASSIAIAVLRDLESRTGEKGLVADLSRSLDDVNAALRKAIALGKGEQGMGTTITALLTDGEQLALAHVGDSRGYRLRGGVLEQITKDQTFIQMLIDAGKLTPEEARFHPRRSVVLQAMTGDGEIEPQAEILETEVGDRLLICSDGLSDVVDHARIKQSLQIPDRDQAAKRLVDLALAAGAPDNVTVLVADVVADEKLEEVPVVVGSALTEVSLTETSPTPRVSPAAPGGARRMVPSRMRMPILARVWVIPVATVLLLGILVTGAGLYVNSQYYAGTKGDQLVVFHGVPQLSRTYKQTDVTVSTLQPQTQTAVRGHNISGSKEHVLGILEDRLRVECDSARAAEAAAASASPSPSTSPASSSASPSGSPSPAASAAAPSATPDPSSSPAPQSATDALCAVAEGSLR